MHRNLIDCIDYFNHLVETKLTATFDLSIYSLLTMNMNKGLTNAVKAITFLGDAKFIISALIFPIIMGFILKRKEMGLIILSCLFINNLFNSLIKGIIHRPRPEILQLIKESRFAFPSGHTMAATSLYGILIYIILKSELDKKDGNISLQQF